MECDVNNRPGTADATQGWCPTDDRQPASCQPGEPDGDRPGRARSNAEIEAENEALRAELTQTRLILDSALDYAIITLDLDGRITSWNRGAVTILGYAEAEALGCSGDLVFTPDDRAEGVFTRELCRAIERGRASNERWHVRRDGTRFWASGLVMPLLDAAGRPQGFVTIMRDRTDVQAEAARRELFMAEMTHNMKNTFAAVQAVAIQTMRTTSTGAEFRPAFSARLASLAHSHDLLTRRNWHDAPLRDVIEDALSTFAGEPGRISVDGLAVLLAENQVATVGLAFHELAINAVKHGALSVPGGRVEVRWTVPTAARGARRVEIAWIERGGPPVSPPRHRGFGSQLLEKGVGGAVSLSFRPEGLECRMSLPIGVGDGAGEDREGAEAGRGGQADALA